MPRGALILVVALLAGAGSAGAAERVLAIEAEVQDSKEKPLGKANMLVAARGTEKAKQSFGALTLTLEAEVGPTFDKDCNLVTITAHLENSEGVGPDKKRELKTTTIHACGKATPPAPLAGAGPNTKVLVTIRPAPSP